MNHECESDSRPLPPGVGPHEGRELDLLLAGTKALAMFTCLVSEDHIIPESRFQPFVEAGRLVRRDEIYRSARPTDPALRVVYNALPGEEWRLDRMHAIYSKLWADDWPCDDATETEIGRLVGYTESEIESFLRWKRQLWPLALDNWLALNKDRQ